MSEVEIREELKDQGVVGMNRVTLKKEGKVIPTNTLFLTFGSPELPKEITVGHLMVKAALFVPNPIRCFNCNKFGHTSQRCKVAAKCQWCGKDKHEGRCEGPSCALSAMAQDCPVWQKEKGIQCVRVIPIPKPGKDHSGPGNFRPIALTSCLCKTMERMINARLMWSLESQGLLSEKQCGF